MANHSASHENVRIRPLCFTHSHTGALNNTYMYENSVDFDATAVLFDLGVDRQLHFENWRTHTTTEKHTNK